MSNSTIFQIRRLFHSCDGARIQNLPICQTDEMQQQEWFDSDDHGNVAVLVPQEGISSCCFELSAKGKFNPCSMSSEEMAY